MKAFDLRILEADSKFYEGDCVSLVIPTVDGSYGILADHTDIITAMVPGELMYKRYEEEEFTVASVSAGIVKVESGKVLILADSVERLDEIDINRAKREAEEARQALNQKSTLREFLVAKTQLDRAINRMKIHNKYSDDSFDF